MKKSLCSNSFNLNLHAYKFRPSMKNYIDFDSTDSYRFFSLKSLCFIVFNLSTITNVSTAINGNQRKNGKKNYEDTTLIPTSQWLP